MCLHPGVVGFIATVVCYCAFNFCAQSAERINQEGRILGPVPVVTTPILFNTPQADTIVSAMQIFPTSSAWNEDISRRPLLSNSSAMITQITSDLASNRRTLKLFTEMNYVLVPDNQAKVDIKLFNYPDESDDIKAGTLDIGTYPIASNTPVETWPADTGTLTLSQWQQDVNNVGGDRHSIMVMPGTGFTWETWLTRLIPTNTPQWQASNGAKFDLNSNALRPLGWTSGDAAGLSMFGALVRYDECERGMVEHAMRLVVVKSRKEYIYPATHDASSIPATSVNYPAMGQRMRLNSGFAIPASWSKEEKAVALALKKYGAIVADNGGFFSISICPDNRFPSGCFNNITTLAISNFEVIQSTGATAGPRSVGAPTVNAGIDQTVSLAAGASLSGAITGSAVLAKWYVYPYAAAPGTVTFGNSASTSTSATFGAPGTYTLMLSATDGIHAVAYDAVIITVTPGGASTPVVSWNNPADSTYPAALGALQLNATTTVAGTFAYSPPGGTILNAGKGQTLSVQFTPLDTASYNTPVPKAVLINVLKGTAVVTLGNLSQAYDGLPKPVSSTTTPASLNVDLTYNSLSAPPTHVGTYAVAATINDTNYAGSVSDSLTISSSTVIGSVPTASVNPAIAGQPVQISIASSSLLPLTFQWDFGDGTNSTASGTASHIFTNPGTYTVTVTVTDGSGKFSTASFTLTVISSSSGGAVPALDSDGDGSSDIQEVSLGTNPLDPNSKPGGSADFDLDGIPDDVDSDADGDGVGNVDEIAIGSDPYDSASFTKLPLTILKLKGGVKFNSSGRDACAVSGVIPGIPALFDPKGQTATLNIAGVMVNFILDAKGRGTAPEGTLLLKFKGKRNKLTKNFEFIGGSVPFKAIIHNGIWSDDWRILGIDAASDAVRKVLELTINLKLGKLYGTSVVALYSAKAGKSGSFKK